jgi:hypothetical protein
MKFSKERKPIDLNDCYKEAASGVKASGRKKGEEDEGSGVTAEILEVLSSA